MHREDQGADGGVQGDSQQAQGAVGQDSLVSVALRDDHDVARFDCKKSSNVNRFLKKQAADWQKQRLCRVFVVENPKESKQVWAYYTLCSSAIVTVQMDGRHTAGFPPKVPMAHLGYMGRHHDAALKGIGPGLLHDMALRIQRAREDMDAWGLWLNAETEELVTWYTKMGFERVAQSPKDKAEGKPLPKAMYAPIEALLLKI